MIEKRYNIGIIADGNRRWAKERGKLPIFGHKKGLENVNNIALEALKTGKIDSLTFYLLSTENIKNRNSLEIEGLLSLGSVFKEKYFKVIEDNGVKVNFMGNRELLPPKIQEDLDLITERICENTKMKLNLCVAYGGQDEIVRAVNKIAQKGLPFTAENISEHLDDGTPLDLIIRTGNANRISNFLTWQSAYSELYFSPKMWPDFNADDLNEALQVLEKSERRFGK